MAWIPAIGFFRFKRGSECSLLPGSPLLAPDQTELVDHAGDSALSGSGRDEVRGASLGTVWCQPITRSIVRHARIQKPGPTSTQGPQLRMGVRWAASCSPVVVFQGRSFYLLSRTGSGPHSPKTPGANWSALLAIASLERLLGVYTIEPAASAGSRSPTGRESGWSGSTTGVRSLEPNGVEMRQARTGSPIRDRGE
ncbi:hypothetical protein C8F01DRAFT_1307967 [Mycena amicta]|nr:hypothetical protein C8F01DRAFT_1307967 [Mycena amicta]